MTLAAKRLVPGSVLTTANVAYYTCPTGLTAVVQKATLCNTTSSAILVNVFLVPTGGSPTTENQILSNYSLAAQTTVSLRDALNGHVIEAGGKLYAAAAVPGGVTLMVSGEEG